MLALPRVGRREVVNMSSAHSLESEVVGFGGGGDRRIVGQSLSERRSLQSTIGRVASGCRFGNAPRVIDMACALESFVASVAGAYQAVDAVRRSRSLGATLGLLILFCHLRPAASGHRLFEHFVHLFLSTQSRSHSTAKLAFTQN